MNHFYLFFNAFTVVNLAVVFVFLFFRKNNSITNRLLALIILNPALNFINNIVIESGLIFNLPVSLFLFYGTAQLYAPLILAYSVLMMGQRYKWFTLLNAFTLLIIVLDIYYGFEYLSMSDADKFNYLSGLTTTDKFPAQMNIINGLFTISMLAHFVVILVKIYKQTKIVKNYFSDLEMVKLKYLQVFVGINFVLTVVLLFCYVFLATPSVEYLFIPMIVNVVYLFVVYYAFRHSAILNKEGYCNLVDANKPLETYKSFAEPLCKEIREINKNDGKSKHKLTEMEIEDNYQKIQQYFTESKPYLDPEINLTKLSSALKACSHNISLTINTKFNQNFFDLINSYRIEEAKTMLADNAQNRLTIEGIGRECGFNTKSAFYRAFSKHANQTPKEYLQTLK